MHKLPAVGMIYIHENPISLKYSEVVRVSWQNAGFTVNFHQGVTPETLDEQERKLNFGKKEGGRNKGKDFTETEKAVWYSHIMMWEIAARKENPLIIIEHDVLLLKGIEMSMLKSHPIIGLCHCGLLSKHPQKGYRISAGGCYMLSNQIAKKMLDGLPKTITCNSDGYIHNYITRYGAFKQDYSTQLYIPNFGSTIHHD